MARQKFVYKTDEIAHLWAHQTQTSARNSQGNFYFEGATIYSYGSHYPIARYTKNKKGLDCILYNANQSSLTTNRHRSLVWDSMPKQYGHIYYVQNPANDVSVSDIEWYQRKQIDILQGALKTPFRCMGSSMEFAAEQEKAYVRLSKDFKIKIPKNPEIAKLQRKVNARHKRLGNPDGAAAKKRAYGEAHREELRAARIAAMELKNKARNELIDKHKDLLLNLWRNNPQIGLRHTIKLSEEERATYGLPEMSIRDALNRQREDILRIEPVQMSYVKEGVMPCADAYEVVTNRGARVPLSHVKRALEFIVALYNRGEVKGDAARYLGNNLIDEMCPYLWKRNGHTFHIGHYPLDVVWKDGTCHVGCHHFRYSEILIIGERIRELEKINPNVAVATQEEVAQ